MDITTFQTVALKICSGNNSGIKLVGRMGLRSASLVPSVKILPQVRIILGVLSIVVIWESDC